MKYIWVSLWLFIPNIAWSANIYVDTTLASSCSGDYSISSRNCTGSDGFAYLTVQDAIDNMSGGDDIFLRGGTYLSVNISGSSSDGDVLIPQSKDGSPSDWSSIQSYPGEWAILDGENNCGTGNDAGGVIQHRGYDKDGTDDIAYWEFSRLEIKNGASDDGASASGVWVNGGPFKMRYCYIHSNLATSGGANPCGWKGMIVFDTVVEYCRFSNNGVSSELRENHSSAGPQWHSDYYYQNTYWESNPYDSDNVRGKNIIRYNYFDNPNFYAISAIHDKAKQYLTPKTNISYTYEDWGHDVHHNIFDGFVYAYGCQQDFSQVHHNIVITDTGEANYTPGLYVLDNTGSADSTLVVVYNNTIIEGRISHNFGSDDLYGSTPPTPYWWVVNNLIDEAPSGYDNDRVINLGYGYMQTPFVQGYDSSRVTIQRNYLYRGNNNDFRVTRDSGGCLGVISVSTYNSCYSETNWTKASSEGSDNLYQGASGADQYITRGGHTITGSTTISNGGSGSSHPYLDNVTFPSYVGATNPEDSGWVDGVLNDLTSVSWLQSMSTDRDNNDNPTWIEGASTPTTTGVILTGVHMQ